MNRTNVDWHRLSPVSVVFFMGKIISQLLKDSVAGLAPIVVLIVNADEKATMGLLIAAGVVALLIGASILQFWFFKFSFQADKILINEGVFKKNNRTINFERIQNINILEPFYFRPFSLVTLQLETAGSRANEVNLAGIQRKLADTIKTEVLNQKQDINEHSTELSGNEANLLATADTGALIKYGLTNNGMVWFFVFLAPFTGMIDNVIEKGIGKDKLEYAVNSLGGGTQGGVILVGLLVLIALVLAVLFSIIGSIFRYHNYQLTEAKQTLKRKSGLLNTHEESTKRSKIQSIVRKTNFIGRWLHLENLIFKQASGQANQKNASRGLFVVPSRTEEQSSQLADIVFEQARNFEQFHAIDKRYQIKTLMVIILPVTAISVFLALKINWTLILVWPIALLIGCFLVHRRWKMFRYSLSPDSGYFQSGLFGYRKTEFPLFKAQRVVVKQSPLQKRRNLATLLIYLASQRITIPYMPMAHAEDWFNQISYQIETTRRSWF